MNGWGPKAAAGTRFFIFQEVRNFRPEPRGKREQFGCLLRQALSIGPANQLNRYLLKKVDALELSVRSANCPRNDNIKRRGIRVAGSEPPPRRLDMQTY